MVEISITDDMLHLEVLGWHKLWAFKSEIRVPLSSIRDARADPAIALGWWKGVRAPGTHLPGVIVAGTYYQQGKRIFWDVRNPQRAIVIDLVNHHYDQLIVEVADPAAALALIHQYTSGVPL